MEMESDLPEDKPTLGYSSETPYDLAVTDTTGAESGSLGAFTADEVEDADFRASVNTSATIVFPVAASRADVMEHLSKTIPTNEYGLPLYYIRSDHLDLQTIMVQGYSTQDEVDNAVEVIDYPEGYPSIGGGVPFWEQLPHEPRVAHILFKRFLALNESEGIRLIHSLAIQENTPLEDIRLYQQEYFWSSRARAYDLFVVAAEAKRREARTRKAEDSHFAMAADILQKIRDRIETEGDDLIEKMDAGALFDLLAQMVKVQRLSLGLTGQNASSTQKELNNPGQTVEFILRQLTKHGDSSVQGGDSIQQRLSLLMSDEATALQAQELVIRATSDNHVNSQKA